MKDVIERTLDVLADPGNKARELLKELAERQGPAALADLVDPKYSVEGSIGIGTIADVPWFMVLPPGASGSAQKGAYVVYLFAADGSVVYLSLNQGTERVKGGQAPLKKRAIDLREAAGPQSDLLTTIDLQSRNTRPRKYEAANGYAKAYKKGAVPSGSELEADIDRFLALLDKADPVASKFDPVFEPTHLVLKWSSDIELETVPLHRKIADEKGSVWWGSSGDPSSPGIGTKTLKDLRAQLEAGVVTHAYLYGGDAVWRTNLEQIETDPTSVDIDRFPTYYRLEDCDLFLRLSDFNPLDANWLVGNVVSAKKPDASHLSMAGGLGNQTTPLYVFERSVVPSVVPGDPSTTKVLPQYTFEWLQEATLWSEEDLRAVIDVLEDFDGPQVLLAGPPGTSKTWVARHITWYLTQNRPLSYRIVQFHPSYSYEEFIEGLRPVVKQGGVDFERVDGVVLEMAKKIQNADDMSILIIDEMNRANLPSVFGELLFLFEYRDEPIRLRYSEKFELPPNLRFLGTANTADRSIRSIDSAMRRRFEVFDCPPKATVIEKYYQGSTLGKSHINEVSSLVEGFVALNEDLTAQLDSHHTIGHTFFMKKWMTRDRLCATWDRQLKPLINEYFFDLPDQAEKFDFDHYWPG